MHFGTNEEKPYEESRNDMRTKALPPSRSRHASKGILKETRARSKGKGDPLKTPPRRTMPRARSASKARDYF